MDEMKIIEVNYTDLPGKRFNGYDLHLSLRQEGFESYQIVELKYSDVDSVIKLNSNLFIDEQLNFLEQKYSMSNLLSLSGKELSKCGAFKNADIVHYHILHNNMISLFDLPMLMNSKKSIWTIHDPWIVTGNCIHPLDCKKWKNGCGNCDKLDFTGVTMNIDKSSEMWKIKKQILSEIKPDLIVASDFTKKYLQESPITSHLKIHKIPFGIKVEKYNTIDRELARKKYNIMKNEFVIGFRNDMNVLKGCKYIFEALESMNDTYEMFIICVGIAKIPEKIKSRYRVIELGWINDDKEMIEFFKICDVFVMPSLAESFGLMAIEAMAAETTVICFEKTTIEEITYAPECGIAVEYKSSDAIKQALIKLKNSRNELKIRGRLGKMLVQEKYLYENYLKQHIELYKEIYKR